MNIGYLGFGGPLEQSRSVSKAKTHKTLNCTSGTKICLGGFGKFDGKAFLTLSL
jgi:hypothetical protein